MASPRGLAADPLIEEARRRAHRRRLLIAALAAATAAGSAVLYARAIAPAPGLPPAVLAGPAPGHGAILHQVYVELQGVRTVGSGEVWSRDDRLRSIRRWGRVAPHEDLQVRGTDYTRLRSGGDLNRVDGGRVQRVDHSSAPVGTTDDDHWLHAVRSLLHQPRRWAISDVTRGGQPLVRIAQRVARGHVQQVYLLHRGSLTPYAVEQHYPGHPDWGRETRYTTYEHLPATPGSMARLLTLRKQGHCIAGCTTAADDAAARAAAVAPSTGRLLHRVGSILPQQSIDEARLGWSRARVVAALGRPDRVIFRDPHTGLWFPDGGAAYLYGATGVYFSRNRVTTVSTTSRADRTRSGIGVGATRTAVTRSVPGARCGTPPVRRSCWLGTHHRGSTVTEFELGPGDRVTEVALYRYRAPRTG